MQHKHYFIVAHRDDALLTFGGRILDLLAKGEDIEVYVVYGIDGSIRKEFLREDPRSYLQELDSNSTKTLNVEANTVCSNTEIREIEEKSLWNELGVKYKAFNVPCAYPLRGYQSFNSKHTQLEGDINSQVNLLLGILDQSYIDKITEISSQSGFAFEIPEIITRIKREAEVSKDIQYNIYTQSGIGGHPDHLILAKLAVRLSDLEIENLNVFVGQDLPYAGVFEWIDLAPLNLSELEVVRLNLKGYLKSKIDLLRRFYKSQLTEEDFRVVEVFHKYQFEMIHRVHLNTEYNQLKSEGGINAIEVMYKL